LTSKIVTIVVLFVMLQGMVLVNAEELIFESISDQLAKNINSGNTEKEITFEDQVVLVSIGIIVIFITGSVIIGMIYISKIMADVLGLR